MVISEKGDGLERQFKLWEMGGHRKDNESNTSSHMHPQGSRDLPTQGRAHARSRGHIVVRFSWPRPPSSAGWS